MSKYIDAGELIAEIKKSLSTEGFLPYDDSERARAITYTCEGIISLIERLQEKQATIFCSRCTHFGENDHLCYSDDSDEGKPCLVKEHIIRDCDKFLRNEEEDSWYVVQKLWNNKFCKKE